MNRETIKRVYFIGIGGIGMSALARLFLHEGKKVSGSDRASSAITDALKKEGVQFFSSQAAENITDDIDMVVYTEAMPKDHPEMAAAQKLGVPMMNYFEVLGKVANEYYLIAVAGTHGKTTTTAMLIDIFEDADLDPTAIVGSLRSKTQSNFRAGKSRYMIVEACEYKRDFLHLEPDVLVITNIEAEHLDYYKDLADVQAAFHELARKVPENGVVIYNKTDEQVAPVVEGVSAQLVDYRESFDLNLPLLQPGMHNRMNAAAAIAAAAFCGVDPKDAKKSLVQFKGTWRRFEYKGEASGAKVYDDYGHHPTEIHATLAGARELHPDKHIVLVYQPHLDSRTEALFEDFVTELGKADTLILTPAYVAREVGGSHDSTKKLAEAISKTHQGVEYIEDLEAISGRLRGAVSEKYVVLVMGAGDITKVASELTE